MQLLFAHHDMLDALDVLGLHPVTPLDHALALVFYMMLASAALFGLRWAWRAISHRVRSTREIVSEPSSIAASRSLEG